MGRRRLWLIEFVTSLRQRTDRAMLFPFWKGWAEDRGVETRWLCVGGRHEVFDHGGGRYEAVVVLDPGDGAALVREVAHGRPTHLLTNETPCQSLEQALRAAAPGVSVASVSRIAQTCPAYAEVLDECFEKATKAYRRDRVFAAIDVLQREPWFARWLGVPHSTGRAGHLGHRVADRAAPRYDAEMFNEAATRLQPMLRIIGGVFCDYRRRVRSNEAYRDVDLSGCSRDFGCAFCPVRSPAVTRPGEDPLGPAARQFQALLRAGHRLPRDTGHYDIHDVRLFRRVDDFARMICALDVPPSTFYFSPRIDHVLRARTRLENALALFAEAGHVLRLFRIGAESFSEAEQARFNKGISRSQIDEVLALIRDLEHRWPGTFVCSQPLAFITFTPWTTLEDVAVTLSEARRWGFPPRGRWLYATLELDRDAPITALAVRDGDIVVPDWEDPALRYSTVVVGTLREGQVPWRFRDPRVATFHAVLVRLCAALERDFPDRVFQGDALYARMSEWVRSQDERSVLPLDFAECLLEILRESPPPHDREALARETLLRLTRRGRAGPTMRERMLWLLGEAARRWPEALPHTRVEDITLEEDGLATFRLNLHGEPCLVRVGPRERLHGGMVVSRRFAAKYDCPSRLDSGLARERVSRVLALLDVLVPRYVPGFLGVGGATSTRTKRNGQAG